MRNLKIMLLAATAVAGFAGNQAQAVTTPPPPVVTPTYVYADPVPATGDFALHGAGASSIQNILVRNFNCIGTGTTTSGTPPVAAANPDVKLAKSSSATSFSTISPGNYAGAIALNCATTHLQPNFAAEYVSTGSGFGRTMWSQFNDDFDGAATAATGAQTIATGAYNPFGQTARWANLQFAFSDAGLGQGDLTVYNANAAAVAGPAITFPMFTLPVTIAFPTTYGTSANGAAMVFNTQGKGLNGTTTLNLTKAAYCGIFNGDIKNWNDATIQALNLKSAKAVALYDLVSDTAARWTTDGAPIRLVGRLDKSGTTDVFTRHLAAVCTSAYGYTGTSKYLNHAETLPYDKVTGLDFTTVRSDVNYKPSAASSKLAGTTNSVSSEYWNGSAIVSVASGTYTSLPTGNVGSGLYLLADGGGKVASALTAAPDYALGKVKLSGKIGYISADFVQPSVDSSGGLQAAALQVGHGGTFALPTVKAALTGFTQLPPQSAADGTYLAGDTRQVDPVTGSAKVNADRANPISWVQVLYADSANTLADPQADKSYPITGTTQFFGYTCYKPANQNAIVNMLGLTLNAIKKDYAGNLISMGIFGGTVPANPGIDVQSNIGIVPKAWATAITNTFLQVKTSDPTGGLYIQNALIPKTDNGIPKTDPRYKAALGLANPTCANLTGA